MSKILLALAFCLLSFLAMSQPANNNFSAAIDITSLIGACSSDGAYTTFNATADQNKGACWDNGPNYNVWFKFTATATRYIKVQVNTGGTEGTLRYPFVALWSTATTQLNCQSQQGQSIDIETDYYGLTAGQTYYISVDNYLDGTYRGTFKLCLSDVADYNFFEGARDVTSLINGCSTDAAYTTVNATADRSKGSCWSTGSTEANYNRWFKFTATSTKYMKVQLKTGGSEGTLKYPMVALWNSALSQLNCQDQQGESTDIETDYYGLTAGQTYYVSVDNYPDLTNRGTFTLCLSDVPEYNFLEGAVTLSNVTNWCSGDAAYSTINATDDRSKGSCWSTGPSYNRWFKFTSTSSTVTIQVKVGGAEGTMQYPFLALWASDGITQLACASYTSSTADISIAYTSLTVGATYYVSVDNYADLSYRGTFTLCVDNNAIFYSRSDGSWGTKETWSTVTYGGAAAATTPTASNVVNIRNNAITVTSAQQCSELNISTTGVNTSLVIDNASLTVNGKFVKTNSSTASNITTIQNNGALNVATDVLVTRSGGTGNTQLNLPLGTMTVGQDMIWNSTSGTVTASSMTLSNSSSVSVTRDLKLTYSGGVKVGFYFNNTSGVSVGRDLTFTSTTSGTTEAIFNNSSFMSIKRNIVRNATTPYGILTFNNSSTLTFNGTANQQIIPASAGSGGDVITYYNIVLNNTNGSTPHFTMGGIASVNGSITMVNGIVQTTSTNYLALLNGATSSLGNSNSYVDGPMTADLASTIPTTFTFPLGKNGSYRPAKLTVTHTNSTSATYTAEHYNASAIALGYALPAATGLATAIDNVSSFRYWRINRSAVANLSTASITLYYGIGTTDGVSNPANLRVVKTIGAGTAWVNVGGTGTASGTGSITSDAFSSFSIFTLGNSAGGTNSLPVRLKLFEVKPFGNKAALRWVTASELNNDYFTIERSVDGEEFSPIGNVTGVGTTSKETTYEFMDRNISEPIQYYRLKQTDFDQQYTYSNIVKFTLGEISELIVYPNPASKGIIETNFIGDFAFYNNMGQVVLRVNDTNRIDISSLQSGVYLLRSSNGFHFYLLLN